MKVRVSMLGGLDIFVDGVGPHQLTAQDLAAALLVYLALERHATRDQVIGMLWPEHDGRLARHSLSQLIYELKSTLGEGWVEARGEHLRVAPWVEADAVEFAATAERGAFEEALRLYRGAFLEGTYLRNTVGLERWVDRWRQRLAALHARVCGEAVAQSLERGDRRTAIETMRRCTEENPFDAGAQRRLIELLIEEGERQEARRQYRRYERRLRSEEMTPPAEIQALVEREAPPEDGARRASLPTTARPLAHLVVPLFDPLRAGKEASEQPGRRRRTWGGRRRPQLAVVVLGFVAIAGGMWALLRNRRRPVLPEASVIAVAPFAPISADTGLARLGFDLASMISANLDGLGGLRTIDRLTIAAQMTGGRPLTQELSTELARRLGASSVVYGTLALAGSKVRVDLRLLSTAPATAAPLADPVTVIFPADSIVPVTDSITRLLLAQIWRRGPAPTPSITAALRTHSLPALRAFLRGEREMGLGRWPEAADAFRGSFHSDTTFWLASWRYRYAAWWVETIIEVDSAVRGAYLEHRRELPPSDQLLAEADLLLADSLSAALATLRRATLRFPDNWLVWMALGDDSYHDGGLVGAPREEARGALERVLELNPDFGPALDHLFRMDIEDRDTVAAARLHRRLVALDPGQARARRLLLRLAARGGEAPPGLLDSVARDYARTGPDTWMAPVNFGFNRAQIALTRRIRARRRDESVGWPRLVIAWGARGAGDSALAELDRQTRHSPTNLSADSLFATFHQAAAVFAWLGVVPPEAARPHGVPAGGSSPPARPEPALRQRMAWADGLLAFTVRDAPGLDRALAELRTSGGRNSHEAESLAALRLALRGDTARAAAMLTDLELRRAESTVPKAQDPPVTSVDRLAAARWLLLQGDTVTAVRLLRWAWGFRGANNIAIVFRPLVLYQLGAIADAQDDTTGARRAYAAFLECYDLPPVAHRGMIRAARAALRRISGHPN